MSNASPTLADLGWGPRVSALFADVPPHLLPGRITRVDLGRCTVRTQHGEVRPHTNDHVAVGDWVAVEPDGERLGAMVPRWSALTRRAPGRPTASLTLAANIDVVIVLHGANRPLNRRRLERELVIAWDSGARPVVVLTKLDLAARPDDALAAATASAVGADVLAVSSTTGHGVDAVAAHLGPGRSFVLIGASGVGKSTLVNALLGDHRQRTQDIREADGRGRHTTTASDLLVVPGGGVLIDTPGIRAIALWESDEGVARAFADIEDLAEGCRFSDCAHDSEPGCAVREAVDPDRLDHWRRLGRELARTSADVAGWQKAQAGKQLRARSRAIRSIQPRR